MHDASTNWTSPIRVPQFGIKDDAFWLELLTHPLLSLEINILHYMHQFHLGGSQSPTLIMDASHAICIA